VAKLPKLKELAARAGRWLGLPAPAAHTAAVVADRFDEMSWAEVYAEARALRTLVGELQATYDYAGDLVRDLWTAAYKVDPVLRERAEMHPGRLVNHQVVGAMLGSDEFAELRRETMGDEYAAAMAVVAQADALRKILEQSREAQQAAQAAGERQREQQEAAAAVAAALGAAGGTGHGDGPGDGDGQGDGDPEVEGDAADAVAEAIAAAERADSEAQAARAAAEGAVDASAPGIRALVRGGLREAVRDRAEESQLTAGWGLTPRELQRMPFDERRRLAERLRTSRLARFARLVGRFRLMAEGERARKVEHVPGEVVGLTLGDDLSRLVSGELANLALPELRAAWLLRWAEGQLLEYETRGEERTGQGAIIACIDCSGSMLKVQPDGRTGEAWAKGLALSLLEQARAERRAFVGILFSSPGDVRVFRFPAGERPEIGAVLDFAEFFWGGGTDFEGPLGAAVEILAEEYDRDGKARGDILMVTDFECGVSEEWAAAWLEAKRRLDFRTFGIQVGRRPSPVMRALCDNVRTVDDLTEPDAARDLFSVI
jgi:uncharacterized protein with von Willebrand factor type A (vWA) domain